MTEQLENLRQQALAIERRLIAYDKADKQFALVDKERRRAWEEYVKWEEDHRGELAA